MNVYISVLFFIFAYMTVWFVVSLVLKRNDVADIAWGLGFIAVCFYLYTLGFKNPNFKLVFLLTGFWGIRLSIHIFIRLKDKKEDFRYKQWREEWGKWVYVRSFFQVFILQGLLMFLISFSAIVAATSDSASLSPLWFIGLFVWLVGFYFETVGDIQLSRFISKPGNKGKIMTSGLWKYTRHPNYFGEVTQWWGIFIIVSILPNGLLAVISPLTISYLILKVSGIPMLEKKYEKNPEFIKYKKVTNAFFPWFPKND